MSRNNKKMKTLFCFERSIDGSIVNLHLDSSVDNSKEGISLVIQSAIELGIKSGHLDGSEVNFRDVFEKLGAIKNS